MTTRDKIRHAFVTYLQNGINIFFFYFFFSCTENQVELAFVRACCCCFWCCFYSLGPVVVHQSETAVENYVEQTSGECTGRTISQHTHTSLSLSLYLHPYLQKYEQSLFFEFVHCARRCRISRWRVAIVFVWNGFGVTFDGLFQFEAEAAQSRADKYNHRPSVFILHFVCFL